MTIGLPVYNCAQFIGDCLRSIYAQTYSRWELIIIDDGSQDGVYERLLSIEDKRVRVIRHMNNLGLAATLNEIVDLATFDFIARMDADDMMHPRRLEAQMEILTTQPEIDLVSTGLYSMLTNGRLVGIRGSSVIRIDTDDLIQGRNPIIHASILARRDWCIRNRYNSELRIAEDLDLFIRASQKDDFSLLAIPDKLYLYREDRNITRRKLITAYKVQREFALVRIKSTPVRIWANFRSWIKTFVALVTPLEVLRMSSLNRRNSTPTDSDQVNFAEIISFLRKQEIPGLSHSQDPI